MEPAAVEDNDPNQEKLLMKLLVADLMCLGRATFLNFLAGFHDHSNSSETTFQIILII